VDKSHRPRRCYKRFGNIFETGRKRHCVGSLNNGDCAGSSNTELVRRWHYRDTHEWKRIEIVRTFCHWQLFRFWSCFGYGKWLWKSSPSHVLIWIGNILTMSLLLVAGGYRSPLNTPQIKQPKHRIHELQTMLPVYPCYRAIIWADSGAAHIPQVPETRWHALQPSTVHQFTWHPLGGTHEVSTFRSFSAFRNDSLSRIVHGNSRRVFQFTFSY